MAEDAFVRMLLEAADGTVADERDIELARAAGRWALSHGWRPYLGDGQGFVCGHNGLEFWVDDAPSRDALVVMVRISPGRGWRAHARYPVDHVGHALDLLAAEGLLPARFSTIGRRALADHAEVLWRAAKRVLDIDDAMFDWACGLAEAAASAERFPSGELAVLS